MAQRTTTTDAGTRRKSNGSKGNGAKGNGSKGNGAKAIDLSDPPALANWRQAMRWQRQATQALAPTGMSHTYAAVLVALGRLNAAGWRPNQRELAHHAGTDRMVTSQVIRALEEQELVTRIPDPADGRVWRLEILPAGLARADEALALLRTLTEGTEPSDDGPRR
jgi:DNA-binding MarR family transcriptional regulator